MKPVTPRVLSVVAPMTQLNTPYPSTAYLTGFLRSRGVPAEQAEPGPLASAFVERFAEHRAVIGPAIAFLQGRDATLAHRIAGRGFLPEGPRFASLDVYVDEGGGDPLARAFGALGVQDRARHLATLYLNDLAEALAAPPTLVEASLQRLAREAVARHRPRLLLVSVPFPGAVLGAFRIAQAAKAAKAADPSIVTVLGGGYVNTELRELAEPRVFHFFDFVTLDAGERPLLALLEHVPGRRSAARLVRTFARVDGEVRYLNLAEPDIPFDEVGTPTWDGLPLHRYLSLLDLLNPMHRLWSDGRWNKLTVAQVARVTHAFADAGILVHADLMYGFPTQTVQDTVDALEYVRQLFAAGCLHSAFWHRFACTVHSPVGQHPKDYGITLEPLEPGRFAKNDVGFHAPTGTDHDRLGSGLRKAVYNDMHGIGLEADVRQWFDHPVPKARVPRNFIARALA
ncbi:MAG: hypothetical protein Fur0014_23020 [Rubrivivax sp.]